MCLSVSNQQLCYIFPNRAQHNNSTQIFKTALENDTFKRNPLKLHFIKCKQTFLTIMTETPGWKR